MKFIDKFIEEKNIKYFNTNLKEKKLVLFGASSLAVKEYNSLLENNIKVDYFCDNSKEKWGKEFCGLKILSLDELCDLGNDIEIIITSSYYNSIYNQLKFLGFRNIYYGYKNQYYKPELIIKYKDKIEEIASVFGDSKSQDTFINLLKYFLSVDQAFIETITESFEFFPSEIFNFSNEEVFIDLAQSLWVFSNIIDGKFKKIYEFESNIDMYNELIDIVNYEHLVERVKCINEQSIEKVKCFLEDEVITLIDIDKSGKEFEILNSLKEIISESRPKISIAVHNLPEDLWKIPLFIKSISPEYKIYIRNFSNYVGYIYIYAIR